MTVLQNSRGNRGSTLDNSLAAMFSNADYRENYLFYAHMISMCSIKIRPDLPAPAAVSFINDHYELYINPEVFDTFSLVERLAILKHEMLHILYDHVDPKGRSAELMGYDTASAYATDCALNQHIDQKHLPASCIVPSTLSLMLGGVTVKENESAEFYWKLIHDQMKNNPKNGSGNAEGSGNTEGKGSGELQPPNGQPMDTHETWKESQGDPDLQKDITKKMIEKAQTETIKSRGTVPSECSLWLEMFSRKSELSWKKILRGIVGNKRIGTRQTIMRRDRRFPGRDDLRGKIKERKFNLLVIADVSGSMDDKAVVETLAEVRHICDITKTDVSLIQIDTVAYTPEKLTKTTKTIQRKGHGGTTLHPALLKAKEHKIDYQALVVLTDGGLWNGDIDHFKALSKKVIWLIESSGNIMDEMNSGKMKAFKLTGAKE